MITKWRKRWTRTVPPPPAVATEQLTADLAAFHRRIAQDLIDALAEYELVHPDVSEGVPCLGAALDAARTAMAGAA